MEILRHLDWGFKHNNVQLRLQIEHIEWSIDKRVLSASLGSFIFLNKSELHLLFSSSFVCFAYTN